MKLNSPKIKEIKPFIPCSSNGFDESIDFYQEIGFSVIEKADTVCSIDTNQGYKFLIRNRYNKELAENLMLQIWVEDLDEWEVFLQKLNLNEKYPGVKVSEPTTEPWGWRIIYVWDPAGVLLHIGQPNTMG